jgi:hypothetical protein
MSSQPPVDFESKLAALHAQMEQVEAMKRQKEEWVRMEEEEKRLAEERRIAEEQRLAEEKQVAEAARKKAERAA